MHSERSTGSFLTLAADLAQTAAGRVLDELFRLGPGGGAVEDVHPTELTGMGLHDREVLLVCFLPAAALIELEAPRTRNSCLPSTRWC